MILIDSDVLIWLTRGHEGASARLAREERWRISVVTYIELAQGCRSRPELERFKRGLAAKATEVVPITAAISEQAVRLIDKYTLSHGLQLADALIAATALEAGMSVLTANAKHFAPIGGLALEKFEV